MLFALPEAERPLWRQRSFSRQMPVLANDPIERGAVDERIVNALGGFRLEVQRSRGKDFRQRDLRSAIPLEVFELDGMGLSRGKGDARDIRLSRMIVPVIDHLPAVDPEPNAVIRDGLEAISPGLLGPNEAGPPHAVVIMRQARRRRAGPIEIDRGVLPCRHQRFEVASFVVTGGEAAGRAVLVLQAFRFSVLGIDRHLGGGGIVPQDAVPPG